MVKLLLRCTVLAACMVQPGSPGCTVLYRTGQESTCAPQSNIAIDSASQTSSRVYSDLLGSSWEAPGTPARIARNRGMTVAQILRLRSALAKGEECQSGDAIPFGRFVFRHHQPTLTGAILGSAKVLLTN